jgi:YegS/Rv2252/BmrU family lipid kinase
MKKRLKTQVIVNPESAKGQTRRRWAQIKEGMRHFLQEFKVEFTEKPLQAIEISRAALKDGAELVIGVGGDGTMNEIANGFYEAAQPINPEATLGIVPSGTGCDLTRSLGIPAKLKDAMTVITEAASQPIDVGKVTFQTPEGRTDERLFLNVADFGVGGEVVRKVNQKRMERKASSYVRCLVSTMWHYRAKRVRIWVDGRELPPGRYLIGAIANGRIFGKGMKIAPTARLDDGLFDAVFVKGMKFLEFCTQGWKLINGSHLGYRKVALIQSRRVEAGPEEGESLVLLELDGEQVGVLPAIFEIAPLSLLVKGYL